MYVGVEGFRGAWRGEGGRGGREVWVRKWGVFRGLRQSSFYAASMLFLYGPPLEHSLPLCCHVCMFITKDLLHHYMDLQPSEWAWALTPC